MGERVYSLKTLRAMARGRASGEAMRVSFLIGNEVLSGYLVNMGSLLSVHANNALHEDIHPNRVVAAWII